MISKIKINDLHNNLYLLNEVQSKDVDFYYLPPKNYSPNYSPNTSMIPIEIAEVKHIKLDKLVFYVRKNFNSNWDYNYEIFHIIKKGLDNEYVKNALEFGKLNRENSKYFDIDNINITENEIVSKLNHINSIIKSSPSSSDSDSDVWLLSNNQTFDHINNKIQKYSTWNTKCKLGEFAIDNMIYIINDLVEDGMILIGQKSICHILTDTNGNIVFEQRENDYNIELTMYFSFINNDYSPESKYFYISVRDIRYHRKKKLQKIQKIRELYGKN